MDAPNWRHSRQKNRKRPPTGVCCNSSKARDSSLNDSGESDSEATGVPGVTDGVDGVTDGVTDSVTDGVTDGLAEETLTI